MKAIELRSDLWSPARLFAAAALLLTSVACSSPGFVEGVVEHEGFFVRDPGPVSRWASDRLVVVLSEQDGGTLRVVSLFLLDAAKLPEGEPIELGAKDSGLPYLDVSWGALDVTERSDGVRVLSTTDTEYAHAESGTIELAWLDGELQGTFHVALSDGGHLDGTFLVPAERR